jgi:hypothetical protein
LFVDLKNLKYNRFKKSRALKLTQLKPRKEGGFGLRLEEVKISTVIRVSEGERLKVHALRHLQTLNLLIHDAHNLHLHSLHFLTVQAVFAVTVYPAFQPRSIARAVLLEALCLLASAKDPFL